MANEVLRKQGDQICFCHLSTFVPTVVDLTQGSYTQVEMDLTSVAKDAAEESDKVDLGARRPPAYCVRAVFEFASGAVAAGDTVSFYWNPSVNVTAGSGNLAELTGADGPFAPTPQTVAEAVAQLQFIGTMILTEIDVTDTPTAQAGLVASAFSPALRYGSLLIVLNSTTGATHSDAIEQHIVFDPIIDEVQ